MEAAKICAVCGKTAVPDAPQGLCPECLMKSGFETRGPGDAAGRHSGFVAPPVEQLAKLFPQLDILELLGQGGMGAVYKARQPNLDRLVALKILPPQSAADPGFAERFNREARALARLNHPNIVAVYDFGQAGDIPYFLMEYVEGWTLRQVVRSGRLPPGETLSIVRQICDALQFAHEEGVVHRDIKPENILLDEKGRIKIADFGIAKVLDQPPRDISLTGDKDVVGTAPYMAPEQLENAASVDHRADIFSLGVVFYELLTGELPLGKFQSPSQVVPVDARLDGVVLHSLEKEPGRRYQQARQVKTDVESIEATPAEALPPTPEAGAPMSAAPAVKAYDWKLRMAMGAAGLTALALMLGVGGLFLLRVWKRAPEGATAGASLANASAAWALLNEEQRVVAQWTEQKFHNGDARRTFEHLSPAERVRLEQRMVEALNGPRNNQFLQAIDTLAALRSTNAVRRLRDLALERDDRSSHTPVSERSRWMAIRALGEIGDPTVVPDLIHLLYRNNSNIRWWSQISLVRLTGRNFGADWKGWGAWWNEQGRQPPFEAQMTRWWPSQPGAEELAKLWAERDRKFILGLKSRGPLEQPAGAEEN